MSHYADTHWERYTGPRLYVDLTGQHPVATATTAIVLDGGSATTWTVPRDGFYHCFAYHRCTTAGTGVSYITCVSTDKVTGQTVTQTLTDNCSWTLNFEGGPVSTQPAPLFLAEGSTITFNIVTSGCDTNSVYEVHLLVRVV